MAVVRLNKHYKEIPDPVYSSYQTNIFAAVQHTPDNLIIEAVAGSGKTTTIVRACSLLPPGDHCFLAFNKKIADELAGKLPPNVPASTIHSLCLRILRNNYNKVEVEPNRVSKLLYDKLGCKANKRMRDWYYDYRGDVRNIISRFKSLRKENPEPADVEQMINDLDLDIDNTERTHELILSIFYESINFDGGVHTEIDFDDMIYHCVTKADVLRFPKYDTVVVDEAQDLNKGQRLLLGYLIGGEEGRIIAVGDTMQAIYGFRGADHFSMKHIKAAFNCKELPLSICYRCSKAVVDHARQFVSTIEPREGAPDGTVQSVFRSDFRFMVQSGDMILCRTWAPLIGEAMHLARNGHNVCVLGKDVTSSLLKWAAAIEDGYGAINSHSINDYLALETAGLPDGQEWKRYSMEDKSKMLEYICEGSTLTLKEVEAVVKEIFKDEPPAVPHVLLSSIHKVKGGEAERVFLLRPDLIPHPMAKEMPEIVQEANLHYVAVTRAKESFWYVREER